MSKDSKPSQQDRQSQLRQPVRLLLREQDWGHGQKVKLQNFLNSGELNDDVAGVDNLHFAAAVLVLRDLLAQGWSLTFDTDSIVAVPPSGAEASPDSKKKESATIREQELIARASQYEKESVRSFIQKMNVGTRSQKSITELVLSGSELASRILENPDASPISPVVQLVRADEKCDSTQIPNNQIWRYFRHTWTSKYSTTPGRSQAIIYRDGQSPNDAVFGIGALSSAVVQLTCRDKFIGWQVDKEEKHQLLDSTFDGLAEWVDYFIGQQISEIYVDDIANDAAFDHLWSPRSTDKPNDSLVKMCRHEADAINSRRDKDRFKPTSVGPVDWEARARSELFKVKRLRTLADILEIKIHLAGLVGKPSKEKLEELLETENGYWAIQRLLRRAKAARVGTVVADLTVCGALEPFSGLTAGKLVAMLSVGPEAVNAYNLRYANQVSEIASAIAGREIRKENRLAFVGTTSLYGSFNQYTRLSMPTENLGGNPGEALKFYSLGKTEAVGSSHLLDDTVDALSNLATNGGTDSSRNARLSSEFGEGSSPRLRKVGAGLSALGWPTNRLMWHGRQREVFGVPLVRNLTRFSLGLDSEPDYIYDIDLENSSEIISKWWWERWGLKRYAKEDVVNRINAQVRAIGSHGSLIDLD